MLEKETKRGPQRTESLLAAAAATTYTGVVAWFAPILLGKSAAVWSVGVLCFSAAILVPLALDGFQRVPRTLLALAAVLLVAGIGVTSALALPAEA